MCMCLGRPGCGERSQLLCVTVIAKRFVVALIYIQVKKSGVLIVVYSVSENRY